MTNDKQILIILIPGFPDSESDTVCLPMQQAFIRTLSETHPGLQLIIFSLQYPYHTNSYQWHNIPVICFDGRNRGGWRRLLLRQSIYRQLHHYRQSGQIIGLLSFWYGECAWIGKKFAAENNLRHYCWIMGQDAKKENKYPARLRMTANELIALSDFLGDQFMLNHDCRPLHLVPAAASPSPAPKPDQPRDIDIMGAGSLIPLKNFELLIDTVSSIKKQIPLVKSLVAGKGPELQNLSSLIKTLELDSSVILAGEIPNSRVRQYMGRSKILLHPSSYEGLPGVCLEALQEGCHVISFCKPMNEGIRQWHTVKDIREMKEKALSILQDPNTSYQQVLPFNWQQSIEKIMRLYEYKG